MTHQEFSKRGGSSKSEKKREAGSGEGEHGQGAGGTVGRKKQHWSSKPGCDKQFFRQHWIANEINAHSKVKTFPDWGVLATRYMANKRTDHKAKRAKRKEAANAQKREYRQRPECKAAAARRQREKLASNPQHKIRKNLSRRLWDVLRQSGECKNVSVMKYLGCAKDELIRHLESKFTKGMTWDNYGSGWHVDHIQPCASFDQTREDHLKICWHWTNLQPLWAEENVRKGDSLQIIQFQLLMNP
jgi:hypothetical protein